MAAKANFLAIAVFFILFVLIANAAEEATGESAVNDSNLNNPNIAVNDDSAEQGIIKNNQNSENNGKAVTASFGVYLNIVG